MAFQLRSGKKPVFKKLGCKTPLSKASGKSPFYNMKLLKDLRKGEGYAKTNTMSIKNSKDEF